jgi:thiol-disulfide isomerase/thioredoxin
MADRTEETEKFGTNDGIDMKMRRAALIVMASLLLGLPGIATSGLRAGADTTSGAQIDHIMSFDGNSGWLNSPPLTLDALQGKIVLVDFWEYTCINCLRTLPYLKAWYSRYSADGFVIIGVHAPEFDFSGDKVNVAAAVSRLGVTWPVVLDDDHKIWLRYQNQAWPQEFLFDQKGNLVDMEQGEGNYLNTEANIQRLLKAQNPSIQLPSLMALLPQDSYDKPGALCYPQTAETYVGPWHGQAIANAGPSNDPTADTLYEDKGNHTDGDIYLTGYWHATSQGQGMVTGGSDSYLSLRYHAIQVVSVMRPENGSAVRVNVEEDGSPVPHADAGSDIQYDPSGMSYVNVDTPRAYELLMNSHFGQHDLRLSPDRFGLGVYSFAFESCEVPKANS